MENENQSQFDSFELHLNQTALDYLRESAKWSMFLAILGFVGVGFLALMAIIMTSVMSAMPDTPGPFGAVKGIISIFYLVIALVYLFPVYYLYRYASNAKKAIYAKDSALLTDAFGALKSHHKFLGIAAIIIISLYILAAIVMVIGFSAMR
ncbi:MAG: hypothetical protein C0525_10675 [Flavobacterium sp.]|uniref:DUF5362 family protein n=1 Tax=Flavobacterium sp. TaxID=239 RepID=UPI000CBEDBB4|nr:DUF5362 family protein [Flavobacterium sp.]MBA4135177.1 hypothetical protein [Flavobacterium sp.]PJE44330.1 MAG: hypothetical protein CUR32_01765 [Flavobacterium sp.] [Flavobacterium sp. FEMGT703F]